MTQVATKIKSALRALDQNAERWLLLVFYTMVVVIITVEVARRFLLSYSSIWGEEVARYAFIYLAWIGASLAVRDRSHIRIDFLLARLPPRGQAVLCIFGDLATLVLASVALFWSIEPILTSIEFGSVTHGLRVSLAWFLAAVPLAFTLIVFRLLQGIRRDWLLMRRGEAVMATGRLFDARGEGNIMELINMMHGQGTVEMGWTAIVPLVGILVLMALGVPVWVSIGLGATGLLALTGVLPVALFGESLFDGIDAFALIAVPLFILTGDVLTRTGLSNRLLDIAEATVGGFRSGMGSATVMGCGLFACISGSDAAGAAAVGRITIDRLVQQGYPKPYACALVAAGACTGILIPPSIAYIIIGLILGVSTSTLFLAALIPGLLVVAALLVTNNVINRLHGYERSSGGFSWSRWVGALSDGRYALLVPVIIFGGIYSGIFTPTEAAAVAAVTTIIIGLFQGTITLADFPRMLESSAKVNGVILPIIAVSLPLAQSLAALELPQSIVHTLTSMTDSPVPIILMMIGILIIAGCALETTPNIVILSPILLPLANAVGMDKIHFCVMMITALGVGFITPPVGLNLFVLSGITGTPVLKIAARAVPFVLALFVVVLLVAFFPGLFLWGY